jgi:hypothetical protein
MANAEHPIYDKRGRCQRFKLPRLARQDFAGYWMMVIIEKLKICFSHFSSVLCCCCCCLHFLLNNAFLIFWGKCEIFLLLCVSKDKNSCFFLPASSSAFKYFIIHDMAIKTETFQKTCSICKPVKKNDVFVAFQNDFLFYGFLACRSVGERERDGRCQNLSPTICLSHFVTYKVLKV